MPRCRHAGSSRSAPSGFDPASFPRTSHGWPFLLAVREGATRPAVGSLRDVGPCAEILQQSSSHGVFMTTETATPGRMGSGAMLYMHARPGADEPTRGLGRVTARVAVAGHDSFRARAGRWVICLVTETYPPEING